MATTLAVGAQLENGGSKGINGNQTDLSAEDSGALYLFTRTGTTWVQKAYIKASNAEAYDEFGSAMALSKDGKLIAVGARSEASAAKGVNGNMNDNSAPGAGCGLYFHAISREDLPAARARRENEFDYDLENLCPFREIVPRAH